MNDRYNEQLRIKNHSHARNPTPNVWTLGYFCDSGKILLIISENHVVIILTDCVAIHSLYVWTEVFRNLLRVSGFPSHVSSSWNGLKVDMLWISLLAAAIIEWFYLWSKMNVECVSDCLCAPPFMEVSKRLEIYTFGVRYLLIYLCVRGGRRGQDLPKGGGVCETVKLASHSKRINNFYQF